MGLLDKLTRAVLLDKGVQRTDDLLKTLLPSGYTAAEWDLMREGIGKGTRELAGYLKGDSIPANTWEWGGSVHPKGSSEVATSMRRHSVDVPVRVDALSDAKLATFHSHPSQLLDSSSAAQINPLSTTDMTAFPQGVRMMTMLDSHGGVGSAIANPRVSMSSGDISELYGATKVKAKEHLGDDTSFRFVASDGSKDGVFGSKEGLAAAVGIGRGLKRANVLEHYDYMPGSEQEIASLAQLEPAIEASAQKAEEMVRTFLKARGISDKDIAAIIAAVGAGGLITMADEINQQGNA